MKALIKYEKGVGKFALRDVAVPEPAENEVLVEVEFAGICGTDVHIFHDTYDNNPPMIVGHEFSGRIVKCGSKADRFKIGDRVVAETNEFYCGTCELCKAGRFCLCNERKALGQKTDGVFAEYALIKESNIHKLDENITMKEAALAEPLSCVVHAIMERSSIKAGDTVLISGPGPIGLLCCMVAEMQGASVILTGASSDSERLKLGSEIGAKRVVDIFSEDLQTVLAEETGGRGVDVVLECSGVGAAVSSGISALKKTGIFTQIGLMSKDAVISTNDLCYKEIDYRGCLSKTNWSWNRTVQLMKSKKLPLEKIISHVFALEDWEQALSVAEEKKGVKVFFTK